MILEVYVQDGCFTCARSRELAEWASDEFPSLIVRLVDFASPEGEYRSLVAATPTFILDGTIVSLGNPTRSELVAKIAKQSARAD